MKLHQKVVRKLDSDIHYPESDGKPMAENTLQALWIIMFSTI